MIVAWSLGGVVGPLVTSVLYEANDESYTVPFTVIAVAALVALALPLVTRMPSAPVADTAAAPPGTRSR